MLSYTDLRSHLVISCITYPHFYCCHSNLIISATKEKLPSRIGFTGVDGKQIPLASRIQVILFCKYSQEYGNMKSKFSGA